MTDIDTRMLDREFERLRRVPPADLPREQDAARFAYMQSKSDVARVRFAMTRGSR